MGLLFCPREQTSVSYAADCDVIVCYGGATYRCRAAPLTNEAANQLKPNWWVYPAAPTSSGLGHGMLPGSDSALIIHDPSIPAHRISFALLPETAIRETFANG